MDFTMNVQKLTKEDVLGQISSFFISVDMYDTLPSEEVFNGLETYLQDDREYYLRIDRRNGVVQILDGTETSFLFGINIEKKYVYPLN